jgi:hypothetical protein
MSITSLFPIASMVLSVGAAAVYFTHRQPWHGAYWLLGAAITAVATFALVER